MLDFLLSYRISDFLLFSREIYQSVVADYNKAIWPIQIACLLFSAVLTFISLKPTAARMRISSLALCFVWAGIGWSFHLNHFLSINWAAKYFACIFFFQAMLFFIEALFGGVHPRRKKHPAWILGFSLFVFSAFVPIGLLSHVPLTEITLFGWGAEMTAVGTLGLLLMRQGLRWMQTLLLIISLVYVILSFLMRMGLS